MYYYVLTSTQRVRILGLFLIAGMPSQRLRTSLHQLHQTMSQDVRRRYSQMLRALLKGLPSVQSPGAQNHARMQPQAKPPLQRRSQEQDVQDQSQQDVRLRPHGTL